MSGGRTDEFGDEGIVLVPRAPGPLLRPALDTRRRRQPDDLDALIDDLFPDSAEGPGLVDAALLAGGSGLLGWTLLGSPPAVATVAGVAALGLGCILPVRNGWRRLAARRLDRRRAALLGRGSPVQTSDPALARLVAAYERLEELPATPPPARAAAHGALLEVASLLQGRTPGSGKERAYVEARAAAVEDLVTALAEVEADDPPHAGAPPLSLSPELVAEARQELDALGGVHSLSRLEDVTAEVRSRGRHG